MAGVMGFGSPPPQAQPSFYDKLMGGLLGQPQSYGGLLSQEEQKAAQRQALMAMGAQLMAAGGPSSTPTSFGQALGPALMAGQQAQQQSGQDMLQAMLLKTKLQQAGQKSERPVAIIDPTTGKPKLVTQKEALGMEPYSAVQRAEAPAVIQEYNLYSKQMQEAGQKPMPYMDWLGERAKTNVGAPYVVTDIAGGRGMVNRTDPGDIRQITTASQEAAGAGTVAGGTATGKGNAERNQLFINEGLAAADSLPTINRAIELLGTVKTGGLNNLQLWASNTLGVTGADEAELSANMGKAVLSQLRSTFGAAFTEREGERLQNIEAGFGKSTEGNKRLLEQAQKLVERAARRGLEAARGAGDTFSADEIRKSIELRLEAGPQQPQAPAAAIEHLRKNPQLKEQFKAKYGYVPDGI